MNQEDFVSYEQAVKLKDAGFNWLCTSFYNNYDCELWDGEDINWNNGIDYSAPTLSHAQKWLREVKGVDIEIRVWFVGNEKEYRPYIMPPKRKDFIAYPPEKSYERAVSAGIEAALELINKKGK